MQFIVKFTNLRHGEMELRPFSKRFTGHVYLDGIVKGRNLVRKWTIGLDRFRFEIFMRTRNLTWKLMESGSQDTDWIKYERNPPKCQTSPFDFEGDPSHIPTLTDPASLSPPTTPIRPANSPPK